KVEDLRCLHVDDFVEIRKELIDFYKKLDDNHPSKKHSHYNNIDQKGVYFAGDISQGTGKGGRFEILHPITKLPCKIPNGGWRFSEEKLPEFLNDNKIHFGVDHNVVPCLKRYLFETEFE